jgi:hypothetical protein
LLIFLLYCVYWTSLFRSSTLFLFMYYCVMYYRGTYLVENVSCSKVLSLFIFSQVYLGNNKRLRKFVDILPIYYRYITEDSRHNPFNKKPHQYWIKNKNSMYLSCEIKMNKKSISLGTNMH